MKLTTQSPSSYEDDDDDSNEEEQVVEQKQQIIQEEEEEEEDDLAEEKASTSGGISSKRSLFQSGDDFSRNPKNKQKMNEVVVALKAKAKRKRKIAIDSRRSKLNLFKKIWSSGDEIIILEGLVNYKEKHGDMLVSTRNYEIFLQSIKDLLSFECTVDQLKNKVKKLREKYDVVVGKLMSGVNNPNEGKPHEEKLYELSKTYWGDLVKYKAKAKANESNELSFYYLDYFSKVNSTGYCNSSSVNLPTNLVAITSKKEWEKTIGKSNAEYLNENWKDWMIADAELFVERCQVILDQTKVMLDLLKK